METIHPREIYLKGHVCVGDGDYAHARTHTQWKHLSPLLGAQPNHQLSAKSSFNTEGEEWIHSRKKVYNTATVCVYIHQGLLKGSGTCHSSFLTWYLVLWIIAQSFFTVLHITTTNVNMFF